MSTQVTLQVDVEDYDLKGNDFMGRYLGVLRCRGAFTPSMRLVFMREDGGWLLF